jgi:regulator of sigma E protease
MAGEGAMEQVQDYGTGADGEPSGDVDAAGEPIPQHRWFSSKSVWQRMAVVLAGPIMNLVLALVVCIGLVWSQGIPFDPNTTVGFVEPDSPAAAAGLQAGDDLRSVAGRPIDGFTGFLTELDEELRAERFPIEIGIERQGQAQTLAMTPERDESGSYRLGLRNRRSTIVGKVWKDGPAYRAGLRTGDQITHINGEPIEDFAAIADVVNEAIGQEVELRWQRDGAEMVANVVPEADEQADLDSTRTIGRIFFEPQENRRGVGFAEATMLGSRTVFFWVEQTLVVLKRLVTFQLRGDALSGPIRIAQFSGEMLRWGFDRLLGFVAYLSVNLFLLNLLPIPVLDGGHAVFLVYEMVVGRRPDQRVQAWATQVGFVLLLLLMAFVLTMDVLHITS